MHINPITNSTNAMMPITLRKILILINLSQIKILFRLGAILPDGANLFAAVLICAVATSLKTFGSYTFVHLAQMAAEVELRPIHTATCAIDALRCNLVSMIHLAPFLRNLNAHPVIVPYRGDAGLTALAVNAAARYHHVSVHPFQFLMLTPPMKLLAVMLSLFAPAV